MVVYMEFDDWGKILGGADSLDSPVHDWRVLIGQIAHYTICLYFFILKTILKWKYF